MSQGVKSNLTAQLLIAGAALAGFSALVLGPLKARSEELRADMEQSRELSARAGEFAQRAPDIAHAEALALRELDAIRARGAVAADDAQLNALIQRMATESNVEIQRLQPRESAPVASAKPAPENAAETQINPTRAVTFSIDASGSYASLTRFVHELQTSTGFTKVSAIRLSSDSDHNDRVRASISTTHFCFPPPKTAKPGPASATAEVVP